MRLPVKRRPAFTIVELLVSMALIMFILLILSEAFVYSVTAFSQLKAAGDLQEKLRSATTILRRDLQANHFMGGEPIPSGGVAGGTKLSSWDMRTFQPPDGVNAAGFFRVWEGFDTETDNNGNPAADTDAPGYPAQLPPSPYGPEGADDVSNAAGNGIHSSRAANHILHFTVDLSGSRPEDYFSARIPNLLTPPNPPPPSPDWQNHWSSLGPAPYMSEYSSSYLYFSPWAEVAYFLRPTNETTGSLPLYALYRRQFTLLTPQDKTNSGLDTTNRISSSGPTASPNNLYYDTSADVQDPSNPASMYFNGPDDVTIPERRMFANQAKQSAGLPPSPYGGSLLNSPWYAAFQEPPGSVPSSPLAGDDLLLQDVLSFEVKALYDSPATAASTGIGTDFQLFPLCTQNSIYSAAGPGGVGMRVFDTWSSRQDAYYSTPASAGSPATGYDADWNPASTGKPTPFTIPLQVRVRALQIIIRVWDKKSQQTRQITVVQDM